MTHLRRLGLAALIALTALAGTVSPALAAGGGDTNKAVAINTADGASVFRLAFSIRKVADGVVDQENLAAAYASCTDCRTVALAFQVVLVRGDADTVIPVNKAVAVNDQCAECVTFASATQIVIGVDGPVKLTKNGKERLRALQDQLASLEDQIDTISPGDLVRAVSAAEAELIAILSEELVPAGKQGDHGAGDDESGAITTTTSPETTTTEGEPTTTTSVAQQTTTSTATVTTATTAGG
jgi:putative peptide zinc metalloprotease protein